MQKTVNERILETFQKYIAYHRHLGYEVEGDVYYMAEALICEEYYGE